jgi:hypothetical protein
MYAAPKDVRSRFLKWREEYTFNAAQEYAEKLHANGHKDWRVPTKGELAVLFENRAAIGGFDKCRSLTGGWYWSSTAYSSNTHLGWDLCFNGGTFVSTGSSDYDPQSWHRLVRCVR